MACLFKAYEELNRKRRFAVRFAYDAEGRVTKTVLDAEKKKRKRKTKTMQKLVDIMI